MYGRSPVKTFDDLVESWEQPSIAAPDLREVQLRDGRRFYTRFRHGVIRLQRDDETDPTPVTLHHGGSDDSVLETEEWKDLFLKLARLHPAIDTTGSTEIKELVSTAETALSMLQEIASDPMGRTPVMATLIRRLEAAIAPFDPMYR